MSDFNAIGQQAILDRAAFLSENGKPPGRFPATVDEMAEETLAVYARATPQEIEDGKACYDRAHDEVQAIATEHGVDFDTVCAVTARCSRGRLWVADIERHEALSNRAVMERAPPPARRSGSVKLGAARSRGRG